MFFYNNKFAHFIEHMFQCLFQSEVMLCSLISTILTQSIGYPLSYGMEQPEQFRVRFVPPLFSTQELEGSAVKMTILEQHWFDESSTS